MTEENATPVTRLIPLDAIKIRDDQIRTEYDEEAHFALVDSLRAVGLIQPILVSAVGDGYNLIAGHRRLKAARYLRWPTIEARIVPADADLNEARMIHENSFREAVAPEDEGKYFQRLAEAKKMSIHQIAKFVGRSHYYVESRLKVTTHPDDIRDHLRAGTIGLGVAAALATIHDQAERRRLTAYAVENGINARTARAWANSWNATQAAVDAETIEAAQAQPGNRYEEPMFPCFGCSRPALVSRLQIIRLCEECYNELSAAAHQSPPSRDDSPGRPKSDTGPAPEREAQNREN